MTSIQMYINPKVVKTCLSKRFIKGFRENASSNRKTAKVFRRGRIKFCETRGSLVIRHQTGTRTSPEGWTLPPPSSMEKKKKKYGNRCRQRRNIAFLCRSNYSRGKVSFFCRLYGGNFPLKKKAWELSWNERERRRKRPLFQQHEILEAKDRI